MTRLKTPEPVVLSPQAAKRRRRQQAIVAWVYLPAATMVLVWALYANAVKNPFFANDDTDIRTQPDVLQHDGVKHLWFHDHQGNPAPGTGLYRPVTVLTYYINNFFTPGEPSPARFRGVNIIILGLLGWAVARWMSYFVAPIPAWLGALLLVVHPTMAEAVNVVSGRATLLAVLGLVLFAVAQRRSILRGYWTTGSALSAWLSALIALGSGEVGAMLIPLALTQQFLGAPPQRPQSSAITAAAALGALTSLAVKSVKPRWTAGKMWLWTLAIIGTTTAIYLLGRVQTIGWFPHRAMPPDGVPANPLWDTSLAERLPVVFSLASYYVKQLIWPSLTFNQMPVELAHWGSKTVWLGAAILFAGLVLMAELLRRKHWLSLGLGMAGGQFLLMGQVLAPGYVYFTNRQMIPMVLSALLFVTALIAWATGASLRKRAVAVIPCVVAAATMTVTVFITNLNYRDQLALRESDVDNDVTNPVCRYQVGMARMAKSRDEAAQGNDNAAQDQRAQAEKELLKATTMQQQTLKRLKTRGEHDDSLQVRYIKRNLIEAHLALGDAYREDVPHDKDKTRMAKDQYDHALSLDEATRRALRAVTEMDAKP